MKEYTIQELCEEAQVPRRTVHFYIQQEILPPPSGAGLAAKYDEAHLLRLRLIPILRGQGKRLDDIRAFFARATSIELSEILRADVPAGPVRQLPIGRTYTQYLLPMDITLMVPASLGSANRQKLMRLLQAADEILTGVDKE